jgi:hypothetical protein
MAKKLIYLLAGLALVLTLCLVSAEQPDREGPLRGTPEPPPTEVPEPQMPEYIYQTGAPDLERVKSFYESQEEVLGQRVIELLDYVGSPEGPTIIGAGYGADGYYSVLLDSWNDNWDVIDRTVETLQELGGEDFPIAFWVGTISCDVKTLDAEEVETEVGLESTDITGGDLIWGYSPETPGGYLQMTAGFRAKRLG